MKNILVLISALVLFFGCTKKDSHQANHDQSENGRSIASVGSKNRSKFTSRKPVKLVSKGFHIRHSSMKRLPYAMKRAYYSIFTKASLDFERSFGKKGRRSAFNMQDFYDLITPRAEAVLCGNAAWAVNVTSLASCTEANSYFKPQDHWGDYGPPASLADASIARCSSTQVVCPPAGLEIVGGKAYLKCVSNSAGVSDACKSFFDAQGYRNNIKLLNECEGKNPTAFPSSVDNVNCGDLNEANANFQKMWTDNCTGATGVVKSVCDDRITPAVNTIKRRAIEENDPGKIESLPDNATCNKAQGEVGHTRADESDPSGDYDENWRAILRLTHHCPRGPAKGLSVGQAAERYFGQCKVNSNLGTPDGYSVDQLIDIYKNKRNTGDANYVRQFARQFGLTPSRFESMFCDSTAVNNFSSNIQNGLEDHIYKSQNDLAKISVFNPDAVPSLLSGVEAPSGTNPALVEQEKKARQEKVFNQLRTFLQSNNDSLIALSTKDDTARQAENLVSDADITRAQGLITTWVNEWNGGSASYFVNRMNNIVNQIEAGKAVKRRARAAMTKVLRDMVLGSDHGDQLDKSQQWLTSCADPTNENSAIQETTDLAQTDAPRTFTTRGDGCSYRAEPDVSDYMANYDGRPIIIFDKNTNTCYLQDGGLYRKDTTGTDYYRWMKAENPLNPADNIPEVKLTPGFFQGQDGGRQSYVMFTSFCTGVDAVSEDEIPAGSVW